MDRARNRTPYLPGTTTCRALNLLCEGYTSKEIARALGNSPATVNNLLVGASRALGLPTGRRILLAVTWTRLCPPVEEAGAEVESPEPPVESTPPIYTLIDARTGRRLPAPPSPAPEPSVLRAEEHMMDRRTALRPHRASAGPLPTQTRSEVGYPGITRHARWVLKDRPRTCQHCGYSLAVEVCHIRPVRTFARDALLADINAPHNLIFLCPNCHREFDAGLWTLPQSATAGPPTMDGSMERTAYSSHYRGVFWDKTTARWRVTIHSAGRRYYVGRFLDEREAALAYNAATRRLQGEHAILNELDQDGPGTPS